MIVTRFVNLDQIEAHRLSGEFLQLSRIANRHERGGQLFVTPAAERD
jgi:hypothetical protein